MHRLVEIYNDNKKLEVESAEIKGHKAKLLINRCKEALKIMKKDFKDEEYHIEELSKHIQQMENVLAKFNFIRAVDYNLDARIDIHLVIRNHNLMEIKDGWVLIYIKKDRKSKQHYLENGIAVCGVKELPEIEKEPNWNLVKGFECKKCVKFIQDKIQKEADDDGNSELNRKGSSISGYGYGLNYEFTKGKVKVSLR